VTLLGGMHARRETMFTKSGTGKRFASLRGEWLASGSEDVFFS
jgi:hypothetical protein